MNGPDLGAAAFFLFLLAVVLVWGLTSILSNLQRHENRLSRLEGKLDALLAGEGIAYDPYANLPPSVAAAVRTNKKIEAIKLYRQATGAGLKEAKDFIEEAMRRTELRTMAGEPKPAPAENG